MSSARRLAAMSLLVVATAALVGTLAARAGADTPPPAGYVAGSGHVEGTESKQDEVFLGSPCFKATDDIYSVRGTGTYQAVTADNQPVVYTATIASNQYPYSDGPIHIDVENTEVFYHGPGGTYGPDGVNCTGTVGTPVAAVFRIWATDHIYRLDGGGNQVPCVGHGTFSRGGTPQWAAQWTLDADCTVVSNSLGTPVTGLARAGTGFVFGGNHAPCFDACPNNIIFDYTQYLPYVGQHVGVTGPASAKVGTQLTATANFTNDGQPVSGAPITFSVSGPGATTPSGATVTSDSGGVAAFSFTSATVGSYVVTASTPSATPGELITGTLPVQFTPPPPPTVVMSGPTEGQSDEATPVLATFTDNDAAVAGVAVNFSVTGPGVATPTSATVATNSGGKSLFTFSGDRAGAYTVTASGSYDGHDTTDTHTVTLAINTFHREAGLSLPGAGNTAVVDPAGNYGYFGKSGGTIAKVDLHTFQQVGSISLPFGTSVGAIDPAGAYAYFAQKVSSASGPEYPAIAKVDLSTLQTVGVLNLPDDELNLTFAAIDPAGHYLYTGSHNTSGYPTEGTIIKIDLDTFQWADAMQLVPDDQWVSSGVISPAGDLAYLGTVGAGSGPAHVIKVNLATFTQVGSVGMAASGEHALNAGLIDPAGRFAYFATVPTPGTVPDPNNAAIVKIDLTTMQRVAGLTLNQSQPDLGLLGESGLQTSAIDPAGNYAYFATSDAGLSGNSGRGDRVVKIDLRTFQRVHAIAFNAGENNVRAAVISPDGTHAYFASSAAGEVVKVALTRPPNPALVAANDSYATNYVTPLTVAAPGLLANDANTGDSHPIAAGQASDPPGGSVTVNPDGSFTYTPDAGFHGTDTFTYTVTDQKDYSAPATVSVSVAAPPVGVSAVGGGACGYYTNVGLFGGPPSIKGCGQTDIDAAGTSPSVSLPPAGSAPITATKPEGAIGLYGPAAIFGGIWPDNVGGPPNSGPISVSTQGSVGPSGSVTSSAGVTLRATPLPVRCYGDPQGTTNCTAPGGIGPGPLIADSAHSTCSANQSGLSGSAAFTNGVVETKYNIDQTPQVTQNIPANPTPNLTINGTIDYVGDSFRVVLNEQILTPDSITVNAAHMYLLGPTAVGDMVIGQSRCSLTADASDAAPVATNDTYTASAGHRLVVGAADGVLGNDADADFGPLRASTQAPVAPPSSGGGAWFFPSDPTHGVVLMGADGSFAYTPNAGFSGTDSFTYVAQDARGRSSAPATVTVNVVNAPDNAPVANNDAYTTVAGTPLSVAPPGVLGNDTDADSDPLTVSSPSTPAHGTLAVAPDGGFTYTPTDGFAGADSFTYTANDGFGGSATGTVNITLTPDPRPATFSVADISLAEGNSGTTAATFTVARTGNAAGVSTVKYRTNGGTATAGVDYAAVGLSALNFAPGQLSATVPVTVNGDTLPEANETFNLVLSAPSGAVIGDSSATATIVNDDAPAYLSVNNATLKEGNSGTTPATFTIARSGNTTGPSSVSYKTSGGTASAGSDYTPLSLTTVTFAPGDTTKTVSVAVAGDTLDEANETFNLVLSAPVGATLSDSSGTATIVDDDGPITAGPATFLAVGDISVPEGNSATTPATFTITRSGDTSVATTVKYKTSGGTATAGSDYVGVTTLGTVSFAGGQSSKTVTVNVNGDTLPELDETFNLVLSAPIGGVLADASATATIVNDDGAAYLGVGNVTVTEGNSGTTNAILTITRSGNTTGSSTLKYKTSGGTATAGVDYTSVPLTTVTFNPGETTKTVTVNVIGDTTHEANETFNLVLSAPTGATISDASATATIVNDD